MSTPVSPFSPPSSVVHELRILLLGLVNRQSKSDRSQTRAKADGNHFYSCALYTNIDPQRESRNLRINRKSSSLSLYSRYRRRLANKRIICDISQGKLVHAAKGIITFLNGRTIPDGVHVSHVAPVPRRRGDGMAWHTGHRP
ncbi:uncharacterized protein LOC117204138 [Bombus bifarius]|uniref:Uncharacterized protein LOC117204138 n=1 Tax=Bombus bifarius TaxID=103933 RepID=A0A6P8LPF3_9HYME|nr:uncharacterized protein LOC117204138 [Bombus bifarius]